MSVANRRRTTPVVWKTNLFCAAWCAGCWAGDLGSPAQWQECGFFICLFKPWRFWKHFKVGVCFIFYLEYHLFKSHELWAASYEFLTLYFVFCLEYHALILRCSKPWKGGIMVARGTAPGNERKRIKAHDASGLKNEPFLRRNNGRCFYWR